MRKFLQNNVNFLAISLLFLVGACGGRIQERKVEHPDAQYHLIIAVIDGQSSVFKEAVIQTLIEKYQETGAIEVMNVSKAEQITQKQYDVVLLIDRCKAGMKLNSTFKKLVAELDQKKLVVFITSGDSDWKYNDKGIDAVTSASSKDKTQEVRQEIAKKIDALLKK